MAKESNFFDSVVDSVVEDITGAGESFERFEPPFGMEAVTPEQGARQLARIKTPEGRRAFREQVGTEAMIKMARRLKVLHPDKVGETPKGRFEV